MCNIFLIIKSFVLSTTPYAHYPFSRKYPSGGVGLGTLRWKSLLNEKEEMNHSFTRESSSKSIKLCTLLWICTKLYNSAQFLSLLSFFDCSICFMFILVSRLTLLYVMLFRYLRLGVIEVMNIVYRSSL